MKRVKWMAVAVGALFVIAGCESDSSGGSSGGEAAAKASADQSTKTALSMDVLKTDMGSEAGLGAALQLSTDIQAASNAMQADNALGAAASALEAYEAPLDAACVTQSGGSATYNNCQLSGGSIDGSITVNGDQITLDLTITASSSAGGASAGATITETGSLTITDSNITGTLNVTTQINTTVPGAAAVPGMPTSVTVQITAEYQNVQIQNGCAVGGSIRFTSSMGGLAAAGGGGNQSFTVTFGGCGDVTLTQ